MFLMQRQRRETVHDDYENYGNVEETTKKELESAWGGDRGMFLFWVRRRPTELTIDCNTLRDVIIGENPAEVEALYRALRRAPLQ